MKVAQKASVQKRKFTHVFFSNISKNIYPRIFLNTLEIVFELPKCLENTLCYFHIVVKNLKITEIVATFSNAMVSL